VIPFVIIVQEKKEKNMCGVYHGIEFPKMIFIILKSMCSNGKRQSKEATPRMIWDHHPCNIILFWIGRKIQAVEQKEVNFLKWKE
jgi:hypothetical protein